MNTLKNLLRKGITIGSFCLVSGTILSAQISLSMQNKSTREVIREIEKVSDYRFFYNDNLSGLNTKISVSAQGENIRDVLEQIKSQAQITYIIKENNQINNEINLCVQKINKTQSYVDDMNENKFMFLYDELPKMIDELNKIEIDEKNAWNRLQKLCDKENDDNMRYPYISIGAGVLCGLLFCFL